MKYLQRERENGSAKSDRKMRRYVLDANALIGFLEDRKGTAAKVERLLDQALEQQSPLLMTAVNWGEVFYVIWRNEGERRAMQVEKDIQDLPLTIVAVDKDGATRTARLKQKHNLGYADAFAAELAIERGAWLVTADPDFSKLGKALSVYPLPRHEN
jgi:predicted nucleic acid-binding protein